MEIFAWILYTIESGDGREGANMFQTTRRIPMKERKGSVPMPLVLLCLGLGLLLGRLRSMRHKEK